MDRHTQPTLAELLAKCDFARLHPSRLRRLYEELDLPTDEPVEAAEPEPVDG